MVSNILLGNTDDHEKTHALLVVTPFEHARLRLVTAFDVLPTHSGQGYQEFICGTQGRDSTLVNAMSEFKAFGLTSADAASKAVRVVKGGNTWKTHFAELGVSQCDIESLAQKMDGDHLLRLRTCCAPERFERPKN